jgi:predicted 3-demethylubiquinone-9 3-methyltransferase (glyoxalase superfamily)
MKHPIYPCLWFDSQARAAFDLYEKAFGHAKILSESPMVVSFSLHGQTFMGLNGGPRFKPNPSISFYVTCETAEEVDQAWKVLTEGGSVMMPLDKYPWSERYGWLSDKFGFSWQLAKHRFSDVGQKFCPLLMFTGDVAGKAAEALQLYTKVFTPSSVAGIAKYGPGEGDKETNVKHAQFRLGDRVFMAMDSSMPHGFTFNEAVSLAVDCDTQQEIDAYWTALTTDGGQESMCGWLKDKFGVSWQIVPSLLPKLMNDPVRGPRVVQAFLKMKKFDIETLLRA